MADAAGERIEEFRALVLDRMRYGVSEYVSEEMLASAVDVHVVADMMSRRLIVQLERSFLSSAGERVLGYEDWPDGLWATTLDALARRLPWRWNWSGRLRAWLGQRVKKRRHIISSQHLHLCPHIWLPGKERVHYLWLQHGQDGTEPDDLPVRPTCSACGRDLADTAVVLRRWSSETMGFRWQHYGACPPGEMA